MVIKPSNVGIYVKIITLSMMKKIDPKIPLSLIKPLRNQRI